MLDISEIENFLKSEQIWFEQTVCMRQNLKPGQAEILIHEFVETLKDRGEETKSPSDAKQHFINWIKKQKKQNETTNTDRSANTQEYRANQLVAEFNQLIGKAD